MNNYYIALGYKCNHACVMCPLRTYDRLHATFDRDEVFAGLERMDIQKDDAITVSGGEPTLVPFLSDVLGYLTDHGAQVSLLTNGTGLADEQSARKVLAGVDLGRFDATLALHSARAEVHDGITGCPGSQATSLAAIDTLTAMGVPVWIKIILNKVTYPELANISQLLRDRYTPGQIKVVLTATDYAGRAEKNEEELFATFAEMQNATESFIDSLIDLDEPYSIKLIEMPLCATDPYYWKLYSKPLMTTDGYFAPNAKAEGNVSTAEPMLCHPVGECGACPVKHMCQGVWESAYRLGGGGLVAPVRIVS